MEIKIRSDVVTTEAIKTKIEEQLGKLNKYSLLNQVPNITAKVVVKIYPKQNRQKITVTIPINAKITLKAEASDEILYNAIDKVVEKLEGQIRKYKTQRDRSRQTPVCETTSEYIEKENYLDVEDTYIKAKEIDLNPMDLDEAIKQMEVLGHDFFVYRDRETNEVSIVYKKKNNKGYGLLETK